MCSITHDNQWHETPALSEVDKMKNKEKSNREYWSDEALNEFWGRIPKQQVNSETENKPAKLIRRFPSGAVRSDDTGRIRPDYISPYAIEEIAKHFTVAENDFGATNYFMGIEPNDILPSVMRHMLELQEGIMKGDRAMIRTALRSLGANSIMGLHQIVMEERGEYVKKYDKTELVNAKEYLKELGYGKTK